MAEYCNGYNMRTKTNVLRLRMFGGKFADVSYVIEYYGTQVNMDRKISVRVGKVLLFTVIAAFAAVASSHAQTTPARSYDEVMRDTLRLTDKYSFPGGAVYTLLPVAVPVEGVWAIKTNLLYDLTATINLGVEFRVSDRNTIDIPFNYNAWQFKGGDRKWKHFLVQPEFRWWLDRPFRGHFFGVHAHYALYNVKGLPFSDNMRAHRYEGHIGGIGASYGYQWDLGRHWGMEATIGLGYAYVRYDKYECQRCSAVIKSGDRHWVGPTKLGVSLIYRIK